MRAKPTAWALTASAPQSRIDLSASPAIAGGLIAAVAALAMLAQADFSEPPRYDGAGYAVLARSLQEGRGYRAMDHPDEPRHAHFPPGYPALLAVAWSLAGPSVPLAHGLSCLCAVGATLAAWLWFRSFESPYVAMVLALALAVNWSWSRTGSAIQSEPFYTLLSQLTILAAIKASAKSSISSALLLGWLLGACLLTRHIAIGLAFAVLAELALLRRWMTALRVFGVTVLLVAPWMAWLVVVGTHRTQANRFLEAPGLLARAFSQGVFYLQRIPDQIAGPLVEVATGLR
ncbi:MAG: glycosyltransferase family 39 protein, partial [Planctomycetaceae bacterium]|nr:glycosyltransferase family 39 protein [Planctomycetaceae bacterium]